MDANVGENGQQVVEPEVEPYTTLLINIENHPLAYMLDAPEEVQEEMLNTWHDARIKDLTMRFDLGRPNGIIDVAARKVSFIKQISQKEKDGMMSAGMRQRSPLAR